jgi:ABC-2 type transport system permease protein
VTRLNKIKKLISINPIIEKELKVKMRGWRFPAVISIYLFLLAFVVLFYYIVTDSTNSGGSTFEPQAMTALYSVMATIQFAMILIITPSLTATSICGERERQTLDLLLCTKFPIIKILIGKMSVAVAHIALLIIASIPVLSMVFLFGGIGMTDILLITGFYLATTIYVASIGIFFSSIFKSRILATVCSYLTLLFFTFGTMICSVIWVALSRGLISSKLQVKEIIIFFSPSPLFGFSDTLPMSAGSIYGLFDSLRYELNGSILPGFLKSTIVLNLIFYILVTAAALFVSAKKLEPIKKVKIGSVYDE